jgi:hypothetical protein
MKCRWQLASCGGGRRAPYTGEPSRPLRVAPEPCSDLGLLGWQCDWYAPIACRRRYPLPRERWRGHGTVFPRMACWHRYARDEGTYCRRQCSDGDLRSELETRYGLQLNGRPHTPEIGEWARFSRVNASQ